MRQLTQIAIPTLVRIKDDALRRLGLYLQRAGHTRPMVFISAGLVPALVERARESMIAHHIEAIDWQEIQDNAFHEAVRHFLSLPKECTAIVGIGGGKAQDVAKYIGFLAKLPYYAVPTSLSNDGFASPQSSLHIDGKRKSLAAALPHGVIVDTLVCAEAPTILTLSGVGDLLSKFTALHDWKHAFRATGEPINDFAAMLSDGSIYSFLHHPHLDHEGIRFLAMALLWNGVAMEICGSSRPASGSEHLISHALDATSARPRLHGLQVGVATYLISRLQGANSERIARAFTSCGFWDAIAADPFSRSEWLHAIRLAPTMKENFFTILTSRDCVPEAERLLTDDANLAQCFVE